MPAGWAQVRDEGFLSDSQRMSGCVKTGTLKCNTEQNGGVGGVGGSLTPSRKGCVGDLLPPTICGHLSSGEGALSRSIGMGNRKALAAVSAAFSQP